MGSERHDVATGEQINGPSPGGSHWPLTPGEQPADRGTVEHVERHRALHVHRRDRSRTPPRWTDRRAEIGGSKSALERSLGKGQWQAAVDFGK